MKRQAMTLLETLVALAIVALCFIAMVKGIAALGMLDARDAQDADLVPAVEALITELESSAPCERAGDLTGGWRYATQLGDHYSLSLWHEQWGTQYEILLREGP